MELRDALSQIAEIRHQVAASQVFRGYRSATTAFSAVVALAAAGVHERWLRVEYLSWHMLYLWLAAAVISLIVVGTEMAVRYRRSSSALQRDVTLAAVEQFAPCLIAGGLLTYVLSYAASYDTLRMLPGLWAILFALGVFASRRVLPRGSAYIGAWYLLAGLLCLAMRKDDRFDFARQMAVTFGGGQLLAAGVLYWMLERHHGRG